MDCGILQLIQYLAVYISACSAPVHMSVNHVPLSRPHPLRFSLSVLLDKNLSTEFHYHTHLTLTMFMRQLWHPGFLYPPLPWAPPFYFIGWEHLCGTPLIPWRISLYHPECFEDGLAPNSYNLKTLKYKVFSLFRRCSFISTSVDRLLIRSIRLRSLRTHISNPISLRELPTIRFLSSAEEKVNIMRRFFWVQLESTFCPML